MANTQWFVHPPYGVRFVVHLNGKLEIEIQPGREGKVIEFFEKVAADAKARMEKIQQAPIVETWQNPPVVQEAPPPIQQGPVQPWKPEDQVGHEVWKPTVAQEVAVGAPILSPGTGFSDSKGLVIPPPLPIPPEPPVADSPQALQQKLPLT